jgi:hypothetical protein
VFHKKSILFSNVAKIGRRTKRTKAVLTPLFEAIRIGVPYKLACMAAGINVDTFMKWRQKDPAFDAEVEQAAAQPAVKLFKTIREQAPETWQAGAWSLERRYPEMFARPEAQLQLNVLAQAAVLNGNGTPQNVQMVVVSDLEFVGLKRHPAYTHRPGIIREAEQVPLELAGTLERENRNIIVTSESAATAKARRYAEIHARTKALLDAREAPAGNGQGSAQQLPAASEPVSAQDPAAPSDSAPAEEPLPTKPSSWWQRFIFGGAVIPKAEAILAVRMILNELRITVDERALDFGTDNVVKSVFSKVLEQLSGSDLGWRTMVQIYERQKARERLWADH